MDEGSLEKAIETRINLLKRSEKRRIDDGGYYVLAQQYVSLFGYTGDISHLDMAIASLTKALTVKPTNALYLTARRDIYLYKGETELALADKLLADLHVAELPENTIKLRTKSMLESNESTISSPRHK